MLAESDRLEIDLDIFIQLINDPLNVNIYLLHLLDIEFSNNNLHYFFYCCTIL